ncbi:sugar ABC transporter substrate-binding protein [Candidatus Bipolaricaulota bacterium]|nr:sugar ABC transporter substrate-binding protein [Candidatus Bipolaricaulota bacterium]
MTKKVSILLTSFVFIFLVGGLITGFTSSAVAQTDDEVTIGYAARNLTNPYWIAAKNGIEDAAEEFGYDVVSLDASGDQNNQQTQVEDLIQKDVDALLITSIVTGSSASGEAADAAVKAGIPVIGVDTSAGSPRVAATIRTDQELGGKLAGERVLELIDGSGEVVVLEGPAGDTNSMLRVGGFEKVIAENPDVEIVASTPADWNRSKGMTAMQDIMVGNPNIDAVWAANDEMALGAVQALMGAGRLDQVYVGGFDATPDALDSISNENMSFSVKQFPYKEGYKGVEIAHKILNGETFETALKMRPWPWGTEHYIAMRPTIVDVENVEEYK